MITADSIANHESTPSAVALLGQSVPPIREFQLGGQAVWWNAVTYGPFPGGFSPARCAEDFRRIATAGFNVIRLYSLPESWLLDLAHSHGLGVVVGLDWGQNADFIHRPGLVTSARVTMDRFLRALDSHPALRAILVGNEIPADLVRWLGPVRVRSVLESLIAQSRETSPNLPAGYANFPTTEYLEPENASFSAFNLYLEEPKALRAYLRRLHHVAGDRPLWISEFGLDSRRHGTLQQAEILSWARRIAREEDAAGFTTYAWSDDWWNRGQSVTDWDFGLTDRQGNDKPALLRLADPFDCRSPESPQNPAVSIIVCTYRGRNRISACLDSLNNSVLPQDEIIVVDDGSDDGTATWLRHRDPTHHIITANHGGLSLARNLGAARARNSWLVFVDDDCVVPPSWLPNLRRRMTETDPWTRWDALGGPNVAPPAENSRAAILAACPGAASQVMIDDTEAEHLPGCNFAVRAEAFHHIGGFDPRFHTAGDDVDFCWRLRDAGYRAGFVPGAALWHHRRPTLSGYLKQQWGYGQAEKLLRSAHPEKFTDSGDARWRGCLYDGAPIRAFADSVIYHGSMGLAPFQTLLSRTMPQRPIPPEFDLFPCRLTLCLLSHTAELLRFIARLGVARGVLRLLSRTWIRHTAGKKIPASMLPLHPSIQEFRIPNRNLPEREVLLRRWLDDGWKPGPETASWDLERDENRLQIAIEHDHLGPCALLLRTWGDTPFLNAISPIEKF